MLSKVNKDTDINTNFGLILFLIIYISIIIVHVKMYGMIALIIHGIIFLLTMGYILFIYEDN